MNIPVEGSGRRKCLRITGPAQAFIALGTVGGHIQEITLLAPLDVVLQLVYKRVIGHERAGLFHSRIHSDSGEVIPFKLTGIAFYFDVTETLESEMGFQDFFTTSFQDELVRLLGSP